MANPKDRTTGPDRSGLVLEAGVPCDRYAAEVLRRQLVLWKRHVAGVRAGEDPKDLHRSRVAAQRLRAGLRAFRAQLPEGSTKLREELGWLRRRLGPVRDMEVMLGRLHEWHDELEVDGRSLTRVERSLRASREEEFAEMIAALDSVRSRSLMSSLKLLLEPGRIPESSRSALPVEQAAPELILRSRRRALRAARRIRVEKDDAARHRARRRLRELRYLVEFCEPLWDADARTFARGISKQQDRLGALQDAAVAMEHVERIIASDSQLLQQRMLFALGRLHEQYRILRNEARSDGRDVVRLLRGDEWKALAARMNAAES